MAHDLQPAGALAVVPALKSQREAFLGTLKLLRPSEWDLATECPAWSVKGIALHVLGDDFSLLSRQRDEATNSLVPMAEEEPGWDFRQLLDGFNERWVHRASFMSTRLMIELLEVTGTLTEDFYSTVDPDQRGEAVDWVGPKPAPYWMLAAREYYERWIHHLQIARATGRPGPTEARLVVPAVASVVCGFPSALSALPAQEGNKVALILEDVDRAWTLVKIDDDWHVYDGAAESPTARVVLSNVEAGALFSRGLQRDAVLSQIRLTGKGELPTLLRHALAAFFGRS